MIDSTIFQEIRELLPADQWPSIMRELFDSDSSDVKLLVAMITGGDDRQAIGNQAHKLKGSSLLLGLKDLSAFAARIEHTARHTNADIAPEEATELLQLAADTQVALQAKLAD